MTRIYDNIKIQVLQQKLDKATDPEKREKYENLIEALLDSKLLKLTRRKDSGKIKKNK